MRARPATPAVGEEPDPTISESTPGGRPIGEIGGRFCLCGAAWCSSGTEQGACYTPVFRTGREESPNGQQFQAGWGL